MAPWLELSNLRKSYGTTKVLDGISVAVDQGEILAVVGPSGTGKSTLLKAIAGLIDLDDGRISIAGRDVTFRPTQERRVGVVFQNYSLFPSMSLRDNVAFPLIARRTAGILSLLRWRFDAKLRRSVYSRTDEVLDLVHLRSHSRKSPDELSGGEQQRAAFARALASDPDLLCLDEPFSALDRNLRIELQQQIRHLHQQLGKTMVYVTHDQSEAMLVANRMAILRCGRIEQIGTPEQVYTHPVNAFVARFLGDCNLLPVARTDLVGGRGFVWTSGGARLLVDASSQVEQQMIAVRPEKLLIRQLPPVGPHLVGYIDEVTFLGSHVRLDVQLDSGERIRVVALEQRPSASLSHRERVYLEYDPKDVCLIPSAPDCGSVEFESASPRNKEMRE